MDALYTLRSCWSLFTDVRVQPSYMQLWTYRSTWQPLYALNTLGARGACSACSALQSGVSSVILEDISRNLLWLQTTLDCPENVCQRDRLINSMGSALYRGSLYALHTLNALFALHTWNALRSSAPCRARTPLASLLPSLDPKNISIVQDRVSYRCSDRSLCTLNPLQPSASNRSRWTLTALRNIVRRQRFEVNRKKVVLL